MILLFYAGLSGVIAQAAEQRAQIGASQAPTAQASSPKPAEGAALLARIQSAAQHLSYVGTFIFQENNQTQSSRITHFADANGEHEKLEVLDGKVREFIRNNEDVRCYIPDAKTVLVEPQVKSDNFPALLAAPATDIDAHYKIQRGEIERVAGHNCNVINLQPRDSLRYGYRLWADQESGLLLKAQTVNEHGDVLEQVSFTEVTIGGVIDRNRIRPSAVSTEGWHIERYEATPVNLGALGWIVNMPIPGFHKIMEVKRPFAGNREVDQIVYSDGLAAISIFIEPAAAVNQPEGEAITGPISIERKRTGDHLLTVIGEAPAASAHQVIESIEFRTPASTK